MRKLILITFLSFILVSCSGGEEIIQDTDLYKYEISYKDYLNTVTSIMVFHPEKYDKNRFNNVENILRENHNKFDAHDDSSELGNVNATAHLSPVGVSDELFEMIEKAMYFAEISDGGYDPTIGPLADLWGIDSDSWYMGGEVPSQADIDATLEFVDYTKVILDEDNKTVFFEKEGLKLDLGGIVKGFIAEQIRDYLINEDIYHGIVNVGSSSQLTIGTRCAAFDSELIDGVEVLLYEDVETAWKIGTTNPALFMDNPIGVFGLKDKALSTSGSAEQFFELDGRRYHHIFDTKTGYPVDNDLVIVQLVSDDLIGVDAISTLVYTLGLEAGMAYVESVDGLDGIFVTYDKKIYVSNGFEDYEVVSSEYETDNL